MHKRVIFLTVILILWNMTFLSNTIVVKANGGIHILNDGTITPSTAPIQRNGSLYTFTKTIKQPITVERDNIIISGAGYSLRAPGDCPVYNLNGISLVDRNNVTIRNMTIRAFWMGIHPKSSTHLAITNVTITKSFHGLKIINTNNTRIFNSNITGNFHDGIQLYSSNNNTIRKNFISNPDYAIRIETSNDNKIMENQITQNKDGLVIIESANNFITRNNVTDNTEGIWLYESFFNVFQYNNFVDNIHQIVSIDSQNIWQNNYWSDYVGTDNNGDGLGDRPYIIDESNQDDYPLIDAYVIPEFSSFFVLPLFIVITLFICLFWRKQN